MTAKQLHRLHLAVADLCVEDIMSMSDAEILAEPEADGIEPQALVKSMNEAFERAFATIGVQSMK